ncbi:class I glutamine amidotransferase-like protein [Hymenopellis radicata]|nr:class I glutamine amidotransferase-like protein [Hymenopellis radicata]
MADSTIRTTFGEPYLAGYFDDNPPTRFPSFHNMPKVAILLCDKTHPTVNATSGDYTAIFTRLLAASSLAPADFKLEPYDVVHARAYPSNPSEYDALLLTGSAASAHENVPWIVQLVEFMRAVLADPASKTKVVGICFGHQIIARALSGDSACTLNPAGWEVGPTPVRLTEAGKRVFGIRDRDMVIQQMHRDYVVSLPEGYELLAENDVCTVQGFVKEVEGKIEVITVQGHPEFTEDIVDKLVTVRGESGILSQDIVKDVARRRKDPTDGAKIADAIWKVIHGDI